MPPPLLRSRPARRAGLAVRAVVSISILVLSSVPSAAEAAPPLSVAGPTALSAAGPSALPAADPIAESAAGPTALSSSAPSPGSAVEAASPPRAAASARWSWPVGPEHPIVRPFVAPPTPYSAGHRGIDVAAGEGGAITAPADGVVHFAGVVVDRPIVSVRHDDGVISSFEPIDPVVTEGQSVARGELLGTLAPGHCARPCVHIGARLHGEYVSPLRYLGGLSPSVLLPTRPAG